MHFCIQKHIFIRALFKLLACWLSSIKALGKLCSIYIMNHFSHPPPHTHTHPEELTGSIKYPLARSMQFGNVGKIDEVKTVSVIVLPASKLITAYGAVGGGSEISPLSSAFFWQLSAYQHDKFLCSFASPQCQNRVYCWHWALNNECQSRLCSIMSFYFLLQHIIL